MSERRSVVGSELRSVAYQPVAMPDTRLHVDPNGAGSGISVATVHQSLTDVVNWAFDEPHHTVLVWRRGTAGLKEVKFETGFGVRITPRSGNVWIIPAGHRAAAVAKRAEFDVVHVTIPSSLVGGIELAAAVDRRDLTMHYLLGRMVSTAGRSDVVARLLREALSDSLRLHLADAYGVTELPRCPEAGPFDRAVQQLLIDYLRDSLDEAVSLVALAGLVGLSVSAFRRSFSATFHTTPHQFLLDLRTEKAKSLLASTSLTMTEIAEATGFSSPSHFATTFKKRVGASPTQYRASIR